MKRWLSARETKCESMNFIGQSYQSMIARAVNGLPPRSNGSIIRPSKSSELIRSPRAHFRRDREGDLPGGVPGQAGE